MNWGDPEKYYAILLAVFFLVCGAGAVMAIMISSEARAETGKPAWPLIAGALLVAMIGWMLIDYVWFPRNQQQPFQTFARNWVKQKTGL